MRFTKSSLYWAIPLTAWTLALPPAVHAVENPIEFNQFLLERLDSRPGSFHGDEAWDGVKSAYLSGLSIAVNWPEATPPPLTDSRAMFSYIFSWVPPFAVAYPTERFYYFKFQHGDKKIMGNIRLADLDQGKVSFAYFTLPEKETWIRTISASDGLAVEKLSSSEYHVTFEGKTVSFKIPRTDIRAPSALATIPDEEFVGQLFDESGVRFFILFNHGTNSFYEVLNEEDGAADDLQRIESSDFYVGARTGFVFYHDVEFRRKLLVGVSLENVKQNNYLDGPGDQVPIALDIREKLHVAYPNTMLGDGVDEHGVYLNKESWTRIAVSPYMRYASLSEVPERLLDCQGESDKSIFWTCLTKEWWNTKVWRDAVIAKLESEGKDVATLGSSWTR